MTMNETTANEILRSEAEGSAHRYSADLDSCTCGGEVVYYDEHETYGCSDFGPVFRAGQTTDAYLRAPKVDEDLVERLGEESDAIRATRTEIRFAGREADANIGHLDRALIGEDRHSERSRMILRLRADQAAISEVLAETLAEMDTEEELATRRFRVARRALRSAAPLAGKRQGA
jgi:hypothetical protein